MNKMLVKSKIDSLINCLNRIESKKPFDGKTLQHNLDLQDIISINLERAIQQVVDISLHILSAKNQPIPKFMADAISNLEKIGVINKSVSDNLILAIGFRNLAVHQYEKLDWNLVADICNKNLAVFSEFIKAVDKELY